MTCNEWLRICSEIGWSKRQFKALREIWAIYRNEDGTFKPPPKKERLTKLEQLQESGMALTVPVGTLRLIDAALKHARNVGMEEGYRIRQRELEKSGLSGLIVKAD